MAARLATKGAGRLERIGMQGGRSRGQRGGQTLRGGVVAQKPKECGEVMQLARRGRPFVCSTNEGRQNAREKVSKSSKRIPAVGKRAGGGF